MDFVVGTRGISQAKLWIPGPQDAKEQLHIRQSQAVKFSLQISHL